MVEFGAAHSAIPLHRHAWLCSRLTCIDQLLLSALIMIATYYLIGDAAVRMANTSSDDGLIAYAYFYRYPEMFRADIHISLFSQAAMVSMLNWLPTLAFKHLAVPPEWSYVAVIYLQNLLLGLGIYRLGCAASASRAVGWISALFTLAYRPQWWNLALYGDLDWMPYAAFLSLALLVWAAYFTLQRRVWPAALFLVLGGLVHVVLGLSAAAMFGGFWLLMAFRDRALRPSITGLITNALAIPAFAAPALLIVGGSPDSPEADVLTNLLKNGHTIPWANPACGYCFTGFTIGVFATIAVTAMAWCGAKSPSVERSDGRLLVGSAALVGAAAVAVHFLAYIVESPFLLRLIMTRASLVLLIIVTPFMIAFVWRAIITFGVARMAVGVYFLLVPIPLTAVGAALALIPSPSPRPSRPPQWDKVATSVCCLGLFVIGFHIVHGHFAPGFWQRFDAVLLSPNWANAVYAGPFPSLSLPMLVLIVTLAAAQRLTKTEPRRLTLWGIEAPLIALPLMLALAFMLVQINRDRGAPWKSGEALDYKNVQAWARSNTAPDASFLIAGTSIYYGWRNYSHRPLVSTWNAGSVYYFPAEAVAYNKRLAAAYAEAYGTTAEDIASEIRREDIELFTRMTAAQLKTFVARMGGDFLIRRARWPAYDLPVAFRNASFVVYDLQQWASKPAPHP